MRSLRSGDKALLGILASDFFGSIAATLIHLIMVFWVLDQDADSIIFTMLVLSIFIPLNVGILCSGIAVNRIGARRLLVFSKSTAVIGAVICYVLLATDNMTIPILALLAAITYCAMGPSVSADVSRVPSLVRLAQRELGSFHTMNNIVLVLGSLIGLLSAGYFTDKAELDTATFFGVLFVIISTFITWASFPKDNLKAIRAVAKHATWLELSRGVYRRIDPRQVGMLIIFGTAALVAVAEIASEVVAPLALREADLAPSELVKAYCYSMIASVCAAIIAERYQKNIVVLPLLIISLFTILSLAIYLTINSAWYLIVLIVIITSSAATVIAIVAFTRFQLQMPTPLQAQAASLWESLHLLTSSAAIFMSGYFGIYTIVAIILITLIFTVFLSIAKRSLYFTSQ